MNTAAAGSGAPPAANGLKPILQRLLIVAAFVFAVASHAAADGTDGANKLLAETVQLLQQARSAAPQDGVALYEHALRNFDAIVSDYPDSNLAVQIQSGQAVEAIKRADIVDDLLKARYALCAEQPTATCLFQSAHDIARVIDDTVTRDYALGNLASNLADAGRFEEAIDTTGEIDSRRSYFLAQVGWYQARAGRIDDARKTLAKAAAIVRKKMDKPATTSRLAALAAGFARAGDAARAAEFLSQTEALYRSLDRHLRPAAAFDVAQTEVAMNDLSRAIRTARAVQDRYYQGWAFYGIAWLQADAGAFDDAYGTVGSIDDRGVAAAAVAAVATLQAFAGDREGAKARLAEALEAARKLSVDSEQDEARAAIAGAQAATGDLAAATQSAGAIKDSFLRVWAISNVALALAKAGRG